MIEQIQYSVTLAFIAFFAFVSALAIAGYIHKQ